MRPADDEPDLGPWEARPVADVRDEVLGLAGVARSHAHGSQRTGPLVVAVDGRSAGGKSTVGAVLAGVPGGALVHTDDIAWQHGFFDWDGLLVEGVLDPLARDGAVDHRPPGWVAHQRDGSVVVPAGCAFLVVEGVGASRLGLRPWLDATIWVQSDVDEAHRRGIERDIVLGRERDEVVAFWDEWMAQELPFLAADRPWERADLVVCGTPSALTEPPTAPPSGVLFVSVAALQG